MMRSTFVRSAFGRISVGKWTVRFVLIAAAGVGFGLVAQNITIAMNARPRGKLCGHFRTKLRLCGTPRNCSATLLWHIF